MGELWLNGISYSGGGADVEITGEASGAIASFADGSAKPLKSLVVDINPIQSGSGDPSPSNVRPISGRSSVEVTVADDTTDPTAEETYEITLGQTVYGGTLNVTTGELTVDRYYGVISLVASQIAVSDSRKITFPTPSVASGYTLATTDLKCDKLKPSNYSTAYDNHIHFANASIFTIVTENEVGSTAADWVQWLEDEQITVCYKLATPLAPIQLSATEVNSLLGNNNIWADSGDSDVVYIRDIDKAFNILWDAVMNSNSGTRSLNLMKGAISEDTKEDTEEPIKEESTEEEKKEGNDEISR